jgi:molybdopterin-containing oxidoreductase family membrane subunit
MLYLLVYGYFFVRWVFGVSGAAVVLLSLAALIVRRRKRSLISAVDTIAWVAIVAGALVSCAYIGELWHLLLGGYQLDRFTPMYLRLSGGGGRLYELGLFIAVIAPQLFWFRKVRRTPWISLLVALLVIASANFKSIVMMLTMPLG